MMEPKAIVDAIYDAKSHLGERMGKAMPGTALTKECGHVYYMGNAGGGTCTLASVTTDIDPDELDGLINELARKQGYRPKVEYNPNIEGVEFVWRVDGERTMDCHVVQRNEGRSIRFDVSASSGFHVGQEVFSPLHEVDNFPPA